jgi:hypothetical protein
MPVNTYEERWASKYVNAIAAWSVVIDHVAFEDF